MQRRTDPVFSLCGKEYRLQIVGKNVILKDMMTVFALRNELEEPNE